MNDCIKPPQTPLDELLAWSKPYIDHNIDDVIPLSGDAGFRRYFRLSGQGQSHIAVYAPPALEKNPEFIHMAKVLAEHHILAPVVIAADVAQGFMLLSDLGDQQLMPLLTEAGVDTWYKQALGSLLALQGVTYEKSVLPAYDASVLQREMDLLPEWFAQQLLGLPWAAEQHIMFSDTCQRLIDSATSERQVVVHRDYHCRNLMVVDDQIAMIDFQDALWGPACYDVVSLLKDCYVSWPRDRVLHWLREYHEASGECPSLTFEQRVRQFDFMGLQRHIKVLGIFARLYLRDGKAGYLDDLPRVLAYVTEVLVQYPEFSAFKEWFDDTVLPAAQQQVWYRAL